MTRREEERDICMCKSKIDRNHACRLQNYNGAMILRVKLTPLFDAYYSYYPFYIYEFYNGTKFLRSSHITIIRYENYFIFYL